MKNVQISQDKKTATFYSGPHNYPIGKKVMSKAQVKKALPKATHKRDLALLEYAKRNMVD